MKVGEYCLLASIRRKSLFFVKNARQMRIRARTLPRWRFG
jgi:hypothetical protein